MRRGLPILLCFLAAALSLAAAALSQDRAAPESRLIVFDHSIGDVRLGMSQPQVERLLGQGIRQSKDPNSHSFGYRQSGGFLWVGYAAGHVSSVETSSPRYFSQYALHVGLRVPVFDCTLADSSAVGKRCSARIRSLGLQGFHFVGCNDEPTWIRRRNGFVTAISAPPLDSLLTPVKDFNFRPLNSVWIGYAAEAWFFTC